MPRIKAGAYKCRPVYWWSATVADLRSRCIAKRRKFLRTVNRTGIDGSRAELEDYRDAWKALRLEIRRSQEKCWSDLCTAVEEDPWGLPYRIVAKKLARHPPGAAVAGREKEIADALFPTMPIVKWSDTPFETEYPPDTVTPALTREEIDTAASRLPKGKAAGPDGVPNEVLSAVWKKAPELLARTFGKCIEEAVFPTIWKRARLVLLHKGPGKSITEPSSFRPLCMLDSAGKMLERIILQRLKKHIDATGGFSPNQYGFRNGYSTEDAINRVLNTASWACQGNAQYQDLCVLVALDVKNAFNTVPWEHIDRALRSRNVPEHLVKILRSYMTDRSLVVHSLNGGSVQKKVTCGVPQGSVLGPFLWNLFYDEMLNMEVPEGVQLVGFANDLAVLAVARTSKDLEAAVNPTLSKVDAWTSSHGLQLAHNKTEAIMIS